MQRPAAPGQHGRDSVHGQSAGLARPGSVLVFRALQLGDWLCATPALAALRAAWPQARITVAGLAATRELMQRLQDCVDEFVLFPGIAGFPEQPARGDAALQEFLAGMRSQRFDLALQLHGSGRLSNGIVAACGARQWAGFVPTAAEAVPGRLMPWPDDLPEPRRYLALLRFLGLPCDDEALCLPLAPQDHAQAQALLQAHGLEPGRTVILHPGARLASRRWPIERFAGLAWELRGGGWRLAVTGSESEQALTGALMAAGPPGMADLTGATTLGSLAAVLARVRLLVCNDTGVSHVAAAMRTPSVVIASGSDAARWAPLDRSLHQVLAVPVSCRPCAYAECPIGHPCALGIGVAQVAARAHAALASAPGPARHARAPGVRLAPEVQP